MMAACKGERATFRVTQLFISLPLSLGGYRCFWWQKLERVQLVDILFSVTARLVTIRLLGPTEPFV
jgi:hypothetical protein